jgi:hypothetical protein
LRKYVAGIPQVSSKQNLTGGCRRNSKERDENEADGDDYHLDVLCARGFSVTREIRNVDIESTVCSERCVERVHERPAEGGTRHGGLLFGDGTVGEPVDRMR